MKQKNNTKYYDKFISLIGKLEIAEFMGVLNVLCVSLGTKDEPRKFEDVFADMLVTFRRLPRSKQKQLVKVIKDCVTCPEVEDGSGTEDTKA